MPIDMTVKKGYNNINALLQSALLGFHPIAQYHEILILGYVLPCPKLKI